MRLKETGGAVERHTVDTTRGVAELNSVPLPHLARTYGLVVDWRSVGLDFEGSFQKQLMILSVGVKVSPFMPLGSSGLRLIASAKPFVGIARQTLAHFPRRSSDEQEPVVALFNNTYGGDVTAGLAYHWRPGAWVFAEMSYRVTSTFTRNLDLPDDANITSGIPWSKWAARGTILRIGIGCCGQ
jgi:hypothetical protein